MQPAPPAAPASKMGRNEPCTQGPAANAMEFATAPLSIVLKTFATHSLVNNTAAGVADTFSTSGTASPPPTSRKERQAVARKRHDQTEARNTKKIEQDPQGALLKQQALFQGGASSAPASKPQAGGKRPRDLEGEEGGGATSKQACTDTSRGGNLDVYENRRLSPADKKSVPPGWTYQDESVGSFTACHTGQMEQKENDRARVARKDAEQERTSADAAATAAEIRVKAELAKAKEKVENEVAARKAAEANTIRVEALLAKAEEVHPTPNNLHLISHTLHPAPYTLNPKPDTLHSSP